MYAILRVGQAPATVAFLMFFRSCGAFAVVITEAFLSQHELVLVHSTGYAVLIWQQRVEVRSADVAGTQAMARSSPADALTMARYSITYSPNAQLRPISSQGEAHPAVDGLQRLIPRCARDSRPRTCSKENVALTTLPPPQLVAPSLHRRMPEPRLVPKRDYAWQLGHGLNSFARAQYESRFASPPH
jgi:hypothetical protein